MSMTTWAAADNGAHHHNAEEEEEEEEEMVVEGKVPTLAGTYQAYYVNVAAAILDGDALEVTAEQARDTARVIGKVRVDNRLTVRGLSFRTPATETSPPPTPPPPLPRRGHAELEGKARGRNWYP